MDNSSFAKLETSTNHMIKISNVIDNLNLKKNDSFIKISNSTINMENCSFTGNSSSTQAALLQAVSCKIVMENISIASVKAAKGICHVESSQLTMHNVSILGNGLNTSSSAFVVVNNSSAFVSESIFRENIGVTGSCFYIRGNSHLDIESCQFHQNIGIYSGGVIFSKSDCAVSIKTSIFVNNSAWYISDIFGTNRLSSSRGGGVLKGENGVNLTIDGVYFANNSCRNQNRSSELFCTGGVVNIAYDSALFVINSTFDGNVAEIGGAALAVNYQSNMSLQTSIFSSNGGRNSIDIVWCHCVVPLCNHTIYSCSFVNNTGGVFVGSYYGQTYLHILSSLFQYNVGALVTLNYTHLWMNSTHFLDNGDFPGIGESLPSESRVFQMSLEKPTVTELTTVIGWGISSVTATYSTLDHNAYFTIFGVNTTDVALTNCIFSSNHKTSSIILFSSGNASLSVVNSTFEKQYRKYCHTNKHSCCYSERVHIYKEQKNH